MSLVLLLWKKKSKTLFRSFFPLFFWNPAHPNINHPQTICSNNFNSWCLLIHLLRHAHTHAHTHTHTHFPISHQSKPVPSAVLYLLGRCVTLETLEITHLVKNREQILGFGEIIYHFQSINYANTVKLSYKEQLRIGHICSR